MHRAVRPFYLASLATYGISFCLPAFEIGVEGRGTSESGFSAFLVAFLALGQEYFGGLASFLVWLANPAFWIGVVLLATGRPTAALVASCAALLLGCSFVFGPLILVGYYVWLGSMALLAGACAVQLLWCGRQFSPIGEGTSAEPGAAPECGGAAR